MILDEDRLVLKDLLGTRWIAAVKDVLAERNILSPKGTPYSSSTISEVYNGAHDHAGIVDAILTVAETRKKEKATAKALLEKRKKALKTKNPKSANSAGTH